MNPHLKKSQRHKTKKQNILHLFVNEMIKDDKHNFRINKNKKNNWNNHRITTFKR